jgi:hypothetical protein
MLLTGPDQIALALQRVGELIQARGEHFRVVIIGGAAMNLLGIVARTTTDVDILAFGDLESDARSGHRIARPPEPLPAALIAAAQAVAREMGLGPDWLNAGPASQWDLGLPPGLESRIEWRTHAALDVGLVGRLDLIYFKLYAAADDTGPKSVHFQDLLALSPTLAELAAAREWVVSQDAGLERITNEVTTHVQHAR